MEKLAFSREHLEEGGGRREEEEGGRRREEGGGRREEGVPAELRDVWRELYEGGQSSEGELPCLEGHGGVLQQPDTRVEELLVPPQLEGGVIHEHWLEGSAELGEGGEAGGPDEVAVPAVLEAGQQEGAHQPLHTVLQLPRPGLPGGLPHAAQHDRHGPGRRLLAALVPQQPEEAGALLEAAAEVEGGALTDYQL